MNNFTTEKQATEGQFSAFIGKNYAYYQEKWAKFSSGNNILSWNWAAFFLGIVWLIYRKMYLYAAIIIVVIILESAAEFYFEAPVALSYSVTTAIYLGFGFFANYLYKMHTDKKIAGINAGSNQQIEAELTKQGGTSLLAALGFIVVAIIILWYAIQFFGLMIGIE